MGQWVWCLINCVRGGIIELAAVAVVDVSMFVVNVWKTFLRTVTLIHLST